MTAPPDAKGKRPFRDAIRKQLEPAAGSDPLQLAAQALVSKAMKGDMRALRELADRLDGKPVQAVEIGGPGEFDELSDDELLAVAMKEAADLGVTISDEFLPDDSRH
jgi:hypothetical protein